MLDPRQHGIFVALPHDIDAKALFNHFFFLLPFAFLVGEVQACGYGELNRIGVQSLAFGL